MIVRELLTKLGFEADQSKVKSFDSAVVGLIGSIKGTITALSGVAVAAGGVAIAIDQFMQKDVEVQQLSKSIGLSADALTAFSSAVSGAGFGLDNVVDLVEEMNNKLGESAGIEELDSVTESLRMIGMSFDEIRDKKPEDQFKAIMNAAIKTKDAQQAASAVDMLMGGEANKMLGVLRQQNMTMEQLEANYQKLNFRTEESRKGAAAFQDQLKKTKGAVANIGMELSGLVGGALTPLLTKLTEWLAANKELVAEKISEWADKISNSVIWLVNNFDSIVSTIKTFGIALAIFIAFTTILRTFVLVMTAVNLVMAMNPIGLIVIGIGLLIAAIVGVIYYWDELKAAFMGFVSMIWSKFVGAIEWVKDAFTNLPAPIRGAILAVMAPIALLVGAANLLRQNWQPIKGFFVGLWDGIIAKFTSAKNTVMGIINFMGDKITGLLNKAAQVGAKVKGFFGGGGGAVPTATAPARVSTQAQPTTRTRNVQMNVKNDVKINVPAGTSQEQAKAINAQVDSRIRTVLSKEVGKAAAAGSV